MIRMKTRSGFQPGAVLKQAEKGGNRALKRAAAFVRGVARRKVKRRKHKNSPPGQPPYAHSGVFKASILFEVDPGNLAAYVGPQRLASSRTNFQGQPVPQILEFGGDAALGMNANWIHKSAPRGTNSIPGLAAYFRGLGTGPIAWGNSPAQADARAGTTRRKKDGTRSRKSGKHPKRYSPVKGRKVYLVHIPIRTDKQAERVAKTVVELFGYPATNKRIPIAARPLMGPSLEDSRAFIAQCFTNFM